MIRNPIFVTIAVRSGALVCSHPRGSIREHLSLDTKILFYFTVYLTGNGLLGAELFFVCSVG